MKTGVEKKVILVSKMQVCIGYFTAFSDEQGLVHFRKDVFKRDVQLMEILTGRE